MKLREMYEFLIKNGIEHDPRGKQEVELQLEEINKEYNELDDEKKKSFDKDALINPYLDSRILFGTGDEDIESIMVGIDVETPEVLLAHQLKLAGKKIDLLLAHHPEGHSYSTFHKVINMQAEITEGQGVPINISEKLMASRANEVGRSVAGSNHQRVYDAAKLLNITMMNTHTIADNNVAGFLQKSLDELKPRYLKDIIKFLKEIPEYKYAETFGNGPFILNGSEKSKPGKIFVDMTGGTEGPKEMLEKLVKAGIGTMICMHMSNANFKEAEKQKLNVIIAGHISSDNLGMNLMLDALEKKFGKLEFIECSGFRRFRR